MIDSTIREGVSPGVKLLEEDSGFPGFRLGNGDATPSSTTGPGSDESEAFRLNAEERETLAGLTHKELIVTSRIRTIALPTYMGVRGLILFGNSGHGKSRLVQTVLDDVCSQGNWIFYNSDMSPPALLAEMETNRKRPIVLEDCEQLLRNDTNRGILRSAMAPPHRVNPKNMRRTYDFVFEAPIYILANLPLNERHGPLAAIASRTGPIRWQLTLPELAVRMKQIAVGGGGGLTVAERWEVAEYCIEELNMGGRVDLRTLCDVGLPARILHKKGDLSIDWREYIDSFVRGTAEPSPERRAERIAREQQIACEVYLDGRDTDDRHRLWEQRTGLKKTAFRDRLREARASGLFDQCEARRCKSDNCREDVRRDADPEGEHQSVGGNEAAIASAVKAHGVEVRIL